LRGHFNQVFDLGAVLLADKGYQGAPTGWVRVPLQQQHVLTPADRYFDDQVVQTRYKVENAICDLKKTFSYIDEGGMQTRDAKFACKLIKTCITMKNVFRAFDGDDY
jgi:hypothetical protein